jgi:hypothetical protein
MKEVEDSESIEILPEMSRHWLGVIHVEDHPIYLQTMQQFRRRMGL